MQLGTRWNVGDEPPARLPEAVTAAIGGVETRLTGVDTSQWRWTLTWLEGRPVVELDDGTTIRVGHDGVVTVEEPSQ
jgi:hypothetical protein